MLKKLFSYCLLAYIKATSRLSKYLFPIIRFKIYIILYVILKYRIKTVRINLSTAFHKKSSYELENITQKFYKYFATLITQTLRSFSLNAKEVKKYIWLHHDAKQLIFELEKTNRPIFITTSHYGNWELSILLTALETKYKTYGIYKKLNNEVFDRFVRNNRAKFGIQLIETKDIKVNFYQLVKERTMFCFIADQTPVFVEKATKVNFLNTLTPFYNGYAQLAQQADAVILYASIQPIDHTHFEISLKEISMHAANESVDDMVQKFANYLEQDIRRKPEFWLWTHRRWKRAGVKY